MDADLVAFEDSIVIYIPLADIEVAPPAALLRASLSRMASKIPRPPCPAPPSMHPHPAGRHRGHGEAAPSGEMASPDRLPHGRLASLRWAEVS